MTRGVPRLDLAPDEEVRLAEAIQLMTRDVTEGRPVLGCRSEDPDLWHSTGGRALAVAICEVCPVLVECRDRMDAVEAGVQRIDLWGVVAGESPRARLGRRDRAAEAARLAATTAAADDVEDQADDVGTDDAVAS